MPKASQSNYYLYNKRLRKKARYLRENMTKAEACLWKYVLKSRQLKGYQFRRQRPVLNYIVDFMCKELMLVIEVDGITHSYENVSKNDIARQKELESAGFRFLRFTDEEILTDINSVKRNIEFWIDNLKHSNS